MVLHVIQLCRILETDKRILNLFSPSHFRCWFFRKAWNAFWIAETLCKRVIWCRNRLVSNHTMVEKKRKRDPSGILLLRAVDFFKYLYLTFLNLDSCMGTRTLTGMNIPTHKPILRTLRVFCWKQQLQWCNWFPWITTWWFWSICLCISILLFLNILRIPWSWYVLFRFTIASFLLKVMWALFMVRVQRHRKVVLINCNMWALFILRNQWLWNNRKCLKLDCKNLFIQI